MSSIRPSNSTWNGPHSTCPVTQLLTIEEKLPFMFEHTSLYLAKVAAGVQCTLDLDKENRVGDFQLLEEIRRITGNILVLDIDRTMLYATAVTSELRVGNEVNYFDRDYVVTELHFKLKVERLRVVDGKALSGTGVFLDTVQICADNAQIPKMNELKWSQLTDAQKYTQKVAFRIVGVRLGRLALRRPVPAGHSPADATYFLDVNRETIRGLKLLHSAVDLSFEGLCVRLRPGLREFLKWAQPRFEVVLFTAAQRKVYEPMLEKIHQLIGGYAENRYWNRKVLFREDCSELHFSNGNVWYMKDIFDKGFPPSRSLLVDDTRSVFTGIEPNGVVIAAFKGAADDCELMNTLKPILERVVAAESADIRYALNGVRPLSPSQRKCEVATVCQKLEELALTRDFLHAWMLQMVAPITGMTLPATVS